MDRKKIQEVDVENWVPNNNLLFSQLSQNNMIGNNHPSMPQQQNNNLVFSDSPENHSYTLPETYPSFYDPTLIANFSRLGLSNNPGSILGNNPVIDPSGFTQADVDWQTLRIQSAVRGQIGNFNNQPRHGLITSKEESNNVQGFGVSSWSSNYQNVQNGRQGLVASSLNNRYLNPINQNGFQSPRNGFRFPDTNNYGFEVENSGLLMDSYLLNGGLNLSHTPIGQENQNNDVSLEELRGQIFRLAKQQQGCHVLQEKLKDGKPEEVGVIFSEVKDHVCELMVDPFGNYVIQKCFEVCSAKNITQLLCLVIGNERQLMNICCNVHGTRAMQKLIERISTRDQRSLLVSVLRRITLGLTKSLNGYHVIQHCLKFFPIEDNRHLLNVVADNCFEIATDKSGCCVLQQCVTHAEGEPKERLVNKIISNALTLSEHAYGNYVVQYLLGMKIPDVTANILAHLSRNFVSLSKDKYGSNVVEKCLRESGEDHAQEIIREIISSPSDFVTVLQNPYGNYVAQSALALSKGNLRHTMVSIIQINYPSLHSHPYGKRVLAKTRGSKQRSGRSM